MFDYLTVDKSLGLLTGGSIPLAQEFIRLKCGVFSRAIYR